MPNDFGQMLDANILLMVGEYFLCHLMFCLINVSFGRI